MPTPSTRTPVRIARGSYSNLNGSVSDLQDGEISYAEDQNKLYVKEGASLVALTYSPASPAFTGTITGVNLTLSGDLTVNGTTTTINTTTLQVEDKNIELGKVSSPSDTTADGGGITLKGASDKTITWINATDSWDFNQNINVTSGEIKILGAEGGAAQIKLYADEADDPADLWRIYNDAGDDNLVIQNKGSGSWATNVTFNQTEGAVFGGAVHDSKGDLRSLANTTVSSAYTLVASDAGKYVLMQGSGGNITVPGGVFSAGQMVTFINHMTSDLTIIKPTNMYYTADGSNANRTLAGKGMATIIFTDANSCYISGGGLS